MRGAPSGLLRAGAWPSETLDLDQRLFVTAFSFLLDMSAYMVRPWNEVVLDPAHRQTLSTLPHNAFGWTQAALDSRNAAPPQDFPEAVSAWNLQFTKIGAQACYLAAGGPPPDRRRRAWQKGELVDWLATNLLSPPSAADLQSLGGPVPPGQLAPVAVAAAGGVPPRVQPLPGPGVPAPDLRSLQEMFGVFTESLATAISRTQSPAAGSPSAGMTRARPLSKMHEPEFLRTVVAAGLSPLSTKFLYSTLRGEPQAPNQIDPDTFCLASVFSFLCLIGKYYTSTTDTFSVFTILQTLVRACLQFSEEKVCKVFIQLHRQLDPTTLDDLQSYPAELGLLLTQAFRVSAASEEDNFFAGSEQLFFGPRANRAPARSALRQPARKLLPTARLSGKVHPRQPAGRVDPLFSGYCYEFLQNRNCGTTCPFDHTCPLCAASHAVINCRAAGADQYAPQIATLRFAPTGGTARKGKSAPVRRSPSSRPSPAPLRQATPLASAAASAKAEPAPSSSSVPGG